MYSIFRDLAIIILSAKFFGLVARKCKAPQVVGEILAGLLIGPCLLNLVQINDTISVFAEIGVVLLMFSTGLGTNLKELMRAGPIATLIACIGVLVPLMGGTLLYSAFYGFSAIGSPEFFRALFIGTIMTATSVSITVATLQELGHLKSFLGTTIVSAAVIDDVIGIIVLTCVLGASSGEGTGIGGVLVQTALFFLVAVGIGLCVPLRHEVAGFPQSSYAAHNDCQPCILLCNGLYCREILWHCGYYRRLHCRYRSLYAARRRLCGAPGRHQQLCDFCADFLCQHRFKDRHQRTDAGDSAVQCLLRSRCPAGKNHRLRTGGQSLPFQLGRLS